MRLAVRRHGAVWIANFEAVSHSLLARERAELQKTEHPLAKSREVGVILFRAVRRSARWRPHQDREWEKNGLRSTHMKPRGSFTP